MKTTSKDIRKEIEILKKLIEDKASKEVIKSVQSELNKMIEDYLQDMK